MNRCRIGVLGLVLVAFFSGFSSENRKTFAQNGTGQEVQNIFLPAPRDLTQRLSRARKAIAEERFSDAVSELGKIQIELDEQASTRREHNMESQDYFMGGPRGEGGTFTSLKTEAQRLLGSMPAKGREWYELQFGSASRALLDEAVDKGDAQKLADASRLYFHTKAGYEATMLLGRYHMDHGRPLAAALCFKRVAETPVAAAKYEPELSLMLATCWLYANMPEKVESAMLPLEKQSHRSLRIGAKQVELPPPGIKSLEWIEKLVGKPLVAQAAEQHQWVMFRGNATRTGTSAGGLPLANARWRVPTVNNPSDEELVKQLTKKFSASGIAAISSVHPLVVDDVVMMRTPERLIAVDFRTGKRVWVYPWDDAATEDATPSTRGGQGAYTNRLSELQQRLWEDSPYGQLSSDGQNLFLIDELGYVSHNASMPFVVMARGAFAPNRFAQKAYNQLVALDIKTQGKLQWKVGDSDGLDEPKLAGAFFLGPPLPLQGQLYCLAEVNGEIRLVVLNSKTGQLVWQQQLAHLDNRVIQVDSARRLAGASPSFADGVLVCPTSGGAVIGVDVSNRTLLWGYQYSHSTAEPNQRMFRGMQQVVPKPFGSRWTDATITISDGRVLVTPPETDDLFCLDLLTGKLSWPTKKRDDNLYVGCVQDGKAFLVGKNKVTAINLIDGKNAWDAPVELPKGASVTGRGFQREGSYYLPTSNSQIVEIDLAKGQITKSAALESLPGNLVCYRDEVISQGVDNLSTYLVVEPLRKHVAEFLKANPDDGFALARLGELQLHDGQRQESLATLRKAHQLRRDDDAIRTLLVKTLLAALRDDFALNRSVAGEIESLIEQPSQRLEYLRLMASGLQKVGDVEGSFAAFLKLISANGSSAEAQRTESVALEQIDPQYSVRRDRWTQGRLTDLYAAATPEQRVKMDALIATQWETIVANKSVPSLQRFVEYYGFHPLAHRARLELAAKLIDNEELLAAEMILAGLDKNADPTIAGGATYQLAKLLAKGQQKELAAEYYQRLEEKYATIDCGGKLGKDRVFEDKDLINQLGTKKNWSYGRVEVAEGGSPTSTRFQTHATIHPVHLLETDGPTIPSMNVLWDPQRGQSAVIRDGLGREVLSVSLSRPDGKMQFVYYTASTHQARAHGHLLMMQVGAEVVAISLLKSKGRAGDSILWRDDLQQLTDNNEVPQVRNSTQPKQLPFGLNRTKLVDNNNGRPIGMLGPIRHGSVFYQRLKEVVCVDPLTGEAIWTRGGIDFGAEIFGDDERLFVVAPGSREALVISTVDGRELGRRRVPPSESRLATHGCNVLSATDADQKYVVQITDVWTGKELLNAAYAKASKASIIGSEEFAIMQPDGTFEILSMADGAPLVRTALEGEPALESIRVFRSSDRYLLLATQPIREPNSEFNINGLSGGAPSRVITGHVYAFDRQSGKSLWQSPAAIDQFAVAEDQPAEIPVLTFLRHLNRKSGKNVNSNNILTSILCIDKRDGRVLLHKDNVNGPTYVYEITGDANRKTVNIALPTKTFALRITDDPSPPEPPAQTGSFASLIERPAATSGGTFGSLFKTLGTAENVARAAAEAAGKLGNADKKVGDEKPVADLFGEPPAKPAAKPAAPAADDPFGDPQTKPARKKALKIFDPFAP